MNPVVVSLRCVKDELEQKFYPACKITQAGYTLFVLFVTFQVGFKFDCCLYDGKIFYEMFLWRPDLNADEILLYQGAFKEIYAENELERAIGDALLKSHTGVQLTPFRTPEGDAIRAGSLLMQFVKCHHVVYFF